jgi:hypothetical protein
MSGGDYDLVVGMCAGAWAVGYVAGYLFKAVRRVIEAVTGVGSG